MKPNECCDSSQSGGDAWKHFNCFLLNYHQGHAVTWHFVVAAALVSFRVLSPLCDGYGLVHDVERSDKRTMMDYRKLYSNFQMESLFYVSYGRK